jgi:hypothetical protein
MKNNGALPNKGGAIIYKRCSAENIKYDCTDQVVHKQQQCLRECFPYRHTLVG